jgi:poly-gamma-glutamate synthesis protein (capsule biosynthesis protein)
MRSRCALAVAVVLLLASACSPPPANAAAGSVPRLELALVGQSEIHNDLRKTAPLSVEQAHDYLAGADVVFTNLEASVAPESAGLKPRVGDAANSHATPEVLDALRAMGFNLLSLANNHALDLGVEGIAAAQKEVDARGFTRAGTGADAAAATAPGILDVGGKKVALIAMASGAAQLTPDTWAGPGRPGVNFLELRPDGTLNPEQKARILESVRAAAERADLVVVYQHNHYWGDARGTDGPPGIEKRVDRFQTPGWMEAWARELVDAGAAVFVAHGDPALHGVEVYRGALILYGLGNYIFQPAAGLDRYGPLAWESAVVDAEFEGRTVKSVRFRPIVLSMEGEGKGAPYLAQGGEAESILARLAYLSRPYGTDLRVAGERGEVVLK